MKAGAERHRTSLQNLAGFVEIETPGARPQPRLVAEAEIAEEIRLDGRAGEEFLIHAVIAEARHRAAIEPQRARRDNEITALQARVTEGGNFELVGAFLRPGV